MSNDPKRPDVGDMSIDATDVAPIVVDLPPGGMLGLRSSQPGLAEALAELLSNQPVFGVQGGVRDEDIADIQTVIAQRDRIRSLLPAASKLFELLTETDAVLDDRLQRYVHNVAHVVERRAKMLRSDELLARYAKTRAYRSAIGNKAARTRQRNQDAVTAPDETPAV
jgi:hypothetical protein